MGTGGSVPANAWYFGIIAAVGRMAANGADCRQRARAVDAERALERADARIAGLRREVFVAALAVGSQLQHGGLQGDGFSVGREGRTTVLPMVTKRATVPRRCVSARRKD